jgi:hypothetical protein
MALTLLEASKLVSGDVVRQGVIEMFAKSSPLLAAIPFMDIPGGSYHYVQEGSLPGVAFRGVNEAYSESVGVVVPQVEVLRIAGGDLDVDNAILKMHGQGVRTTHESMKVKALALYLGKKIIKGDSVTSPKEFDGLQNRITGNQLINAGSTNGGDPLSLAKLDELIDAVDFPTHLVMSQAMVRRLTQAARSSTVGGFITWDVDEFGRRVAKYNDLPILVPEHDDTGARVLDFNEVGSGGATATATSIYCVNFSEGAVTGLQNGIMDVRDLGELDSKPVWRTRVEWLVGLATMHGRCAARLRGISDAAVVA